MTMSSEKVPQKLEGVDFFPIHLHFCSFKYPTKLALGAIACIYK